MDRNETFCGLGKRGINEAHIAAKALKASGQSFDMCFTSCLERAKHTAEIIRDEMDMATDHIQYEWRLNERHYGALQGELRHEMIEKYGPSDIKKWRSDYRAKPPELAETDPRWLEQLERLPQIPLTQHPRSESMFEVAQRTKILCEEQIQPALKANKNVLVIAHTNSIRTLAGNIEGFNEAQSSKFRISTAVPRHYELDDTLKLLKVRDLTRNPKARIRHWAMRRKLKRLDEF